MSKRSLLFTLAVCSAAFSAVHPANADNVPGAPAPGTAANHELRIKDLGLTEVKNQVVTAVGPDGGATTGNPVCDGYLVMKETPGAGVPGNSDVVVFHNATGLPSGACDATCVTLLSDPVNEEAGSVLPATGCLFQVTDPVTGACGAMLPDYPLCAAGAACVSGSQCVPRNLLGLTAEIVAAGAGVTPAANPTQTVQENFFAAGGQGSPYDAGATAVNAYTIFSEVPALPAWAFALLGGVLAGSAFVVLRRRGSMTPAA